MTQSMTISFSNFLVSPAKAKEWLTKSEQDEEFRNRKVDESRVKQYAAEMKAGRWQTDTGECIKFTPDGIMIDGQHRCLAIILANVSLVLTVAKNVDKEKATVLDTGKSRSIGDAMTIKKIPCSNEHAAGITQYFQFVKEEKDAKLSNDLAIDMYLQDEEFWRGVHSLSTHYYKEISRMLNPSFIYATIAYLKKHSKHANKIESFYDEVCVDGMVKNGTVKNFRKIINQAYNDKKSNLNKAYMVAYFVKCWNAFLRDKTKGLQYDPSVEGIVNMKQAL